MLDQFPGDIESEDKVSNLGLEALGISIKIVLFARYHNSIVIYLGMEHTFKAFLWEFLERDGISLELGGRGGSSSL